MPHEIAPGVLSWASELDDVTAEQAARTARLPILAGPIALMPDAHLGMGATIGSVIPTETAVIPSAVGVDIGCGMAARRLRIARRQLPDAGLDGWVDRMRRASRRGSDVGTARHRTRRGPGSRSTRRRRRLPTTSGQPSSSARWVLATISSSWPPTRTVGSGSCCTPALVVGEQARDLAHQDGEATARGTRHAARGSRAGLAPAGEPEFDAYIRDLAWSQAYAGENRRLMLVATHRQLEVMLGRELTPTDEVNCHHNYTELEEFDGRRLWITRKGAIHAGVGARA